MFDDSSFLELYRKSGALLEGHFQLSSGLHSNCYLQSALVLQEPPQAERLCQALAQRLPAGIEVVVGPALGGIVAAYELARVLGAKGQFTERKGGIMALRRGFWLPKGAHVLLMDDVVTTGGSLRECRKALQDEGSTIVGCGCLVDRSQGTADLLGLPLFALVDLPARSWEPSECPRCAAGEPLERPGSR